MTLVDTDRTWFLSDLKDDWKSFHTEEPDNHADRFCVELLNILMDTINGRNDLSIEGLTPCEISSFISRLWAVEGNWLNELMMVSYHECGDHSEG